MKRYDLMMNSKHYESFEEMVENENGEWVRFEDIEALLNQRHKRTCLCEIYETCIVCRPFPQ